MDQQQTQQLPEEVIQITATNSKRRKTLQLYTSSLVDATDSCDDNENIVPYPKRRLMRQQGHRNLVAAKNTLNVIVATEILPTSKLLVVTP
jgi:hypothetical protein